jgi:hypothetical protein
MNETSQPKQLINNNEFNNLMEKLEKDGEKKVKDLLTKKENSNFVSTAFLSGLTNGSVPIQKPSADLGNSLINIMSAGADEFKEKTGRNMTYSEMRQLYG